MQMKSPLLDKESVCYQTVAVDIAAVDIAAVFSAWEWKQGKYYLNTVLKTIYQHGFYKKLCSAKEIKNEPHGAARANNNNVATINNCLHTIISVGQPSAPHEFAYKC